MKATRVPGAALGAENHARTCDVLYRILFPWNPSDTQHYPIFAALSLASIDATRVDATGADMVRILTRGDADPALTELAARAWLRYVPQLADVTMQAGAFFMAIVLDMGAMLPYATFGRVTDLMWAPAVCREMTAMRCGVHRLREYVHAEILDGISTEYLVHVYDGDPDAMMEELQTRLWDRAPQIEFFLQELLVPRVKLFNGYTGEEFSAGDWMQLRGMLERQGRDLAVELPEYNKPSQEQLQAIQRERATYYDGWKHFNLTTSGPPTEETLVYGRSARDHTRVNGDPRSGQHAAGK